MDKTNNLDIFMTDLADSLREATGETGSINAQSFSTRITGLGTGKQDKLVSGENIKTINGESILGSGDITISGGGSSSGGSSMQGIPEEKVHFSFLGSYSLSVSPNKFYNIETTTGGMGASISLDIALESPSNSNIVNEYMISILVDSDCTISLPEFISWANGEVPVFKAGYTYDISIVNYLAVFAEYESI